jgi:exopolysaccharide biosynthesis polyprenyl glycosylphosphotransferase
MWYELIHHLFWGCLPTAGGWAVPKRFTASLEIGAHPMEVDDVLMLRLTPPHLRPAQRAIKRLLDVAGSLGLILLTAPVLLAAAILVRLTSAGPALFRQTRVGADGREYTLLKLRTMIVDAEQHTGPILAARNDPRITRIGRFLRDRRIDELPQLINVLTGDMSLIGPRPERPHFVRIFRDQLPGYEFRLAVKPGITGLAQIYGRYSTTPELKLRFDLTYIYNYSLRMDIQIFFKTIFIVLQPGRAEGFSQAPFATPAPRGETATEPVPDR